jgi:hypothetical protein
MRIASAAGSPTSRSSLRAIDARSDMPGVCSGEERPSSDQISCQLRRHIASNDASTVALSLTAIHDLGKGDRFIFLYQPAKNIDLSPYLRESAGDRARWGGEASHSGSDGGDAPP